jgi:hypothetical protein
MMSGDHVTSAFTKFSRILTVRATSLLYDWLECTA